MRLLFFFFLFLFFCPNCNVRFEPELVYLCRPGNGFAPRFPFWCGRQRRSSSSSAALGRAQRRAAPRQTPGTLRKHRLNGYISFIWCVLLLLEVVEQRVCAGLCAANNNENNTIFF